jgi:hypothetical protein
MICNICRYEPCSCKTELPEIIKCSDGRYYSNKNLMNRDTDEDQSIKQTVGKIPMGNLLDFKHALEQVSKVRAFGNNKYPNKHSYKEIPSPLLIDATFRHLWNSGLDDESGVHHIYHAIVNLLMIAEKDRL